MLKNTRERVIPEKMKMTNELLLEHMARYHFATQFTYGRVLDFACGSGYGSHIIAKKGKKKVQDVIGIDIDEDAIKYARHTYYHPLSTFIKGDVIDPSLPEQLGQFDSIISFETYEHIREEEQFLLNINRLLKRNGTLILSTPFGKGRGKPSGTPFHVHQITESEFKSLLDDSYINTEFYYQKGPLIVPESYRNDYYPIGIVVARKR